VFPVQNAGTERGSKNKKRNEEKALSKKLNISIDSARQERPVDLGVDQKRKIAENKQNLRGGNGEKKKKPNVKGKLRNRKDGKLQLQGVYRTGRS